MYPTRNLIASIDTINATILPTDNINISNVTGVIPNPVNCTDGQEVLIKFVGDMSKIAIPVSWSKYKPLPTSYGNIYNVFRITSIKANSGEFDHFIEYIGGK